MADLQIGKAPPNSAILPFYATGAIAFLVLTLLLFSSADSFTGHYFSPHTLTWVHTAALGWGTMIIFGAAHQLLPVICERDLFKVNLASFSFYTLTSGVMLLAFSFWNFRVGWMMIAGGSLIVLSVLFYAINVIMTSRIYQSYSIQKLFIISSALWLLFTVVVGLLLAINLSHPFFARSHMEILKLHAHAGLAGWFLQLIIGVSSKLVPMFLLGKSSKDKLLNCAFIVQNIGLFAFLIDGYFLGSSSRFLIYGALILIGIVCWLLYLYDTFKKRVRKKIELLMKQTFFSFLCLLLSVSLLPVVYFSKGTQWSLLYGTLLFLGWITNIILGMTFKTLPFIVWNDHYKMLSGKVKVPLPKQLYNEKLLPWQFRSTIAALVSLSVGIIFQQLWIIQIALGLWIVVAVLYNWNVFKVLMHKTNTTL